MLVVLPRIGTVAAWRDQARMLASQGVPPEDVLWRVGEGAADLFADLAPTASQPSETLSLPKAAVSGLETALCHRDPERFARAYDIVLRLARKRLRWGDRSDPAMHRLLAQGQAVRRDIHKMHAFVRFREIEVPGTRRAFTAWFEPEHPILEAATPFFARRFGDMDWAIATPGMTATFEAGELRFAETQGREAPPEDATEALWCTYFANIFNPARLNVTAMASEMPRKYWRGLPEAALIPELIRTAPARAQAMAEAQPKTPHARTEQWRRAGAAPPEPPATLAALKPALDRCRRCAIGACATQGVAGEGPETSKLMIVGEQPGDQEDLAGRPFVGPAGQLFDRLADQAGLDRAEAYLTNAVKHFKFTPRGKQRLHQRPGAGEIESCRWWLDFERDRLKPRVTLAMGATAACALTGSGEDMLKRRGGLEMARDGGAVVITLHPSHLLRLGNDPKRAGLEAAFRDDLSQALRLANS